jgi:hypothetical protein
MEYIMNMNTSLRVAVVMLLGTTMQGTFAASPTDPIKIASEVGNFTSVQGLSVTSFNIPVMKDKIVKPKANGSDEPYFVNITLLDGAQFGSIPTLTCEYTNAGAKSALVDSPPATVGGSVATFRLTPDSISNSAFVADTITSDVCTLDFAATAFILTSGSKEYGIRVTAAHFDAYEKVSATVLGKLVTFAQGVVASVQQGAVTVDVSSPSLSKEFVSAGWVTQNAVDTRVALLGTINLKPSTDVKSLDGVDVAVGTFLDKYTLTLSGSPLAAAQETAGTGVAKSAGVYLSTNGCTDDNAAATLHFASGTQISFVDVAPVATLSVCMIANNVNLIDRGLIGFTINGVVGKVVPGSDPTLTSVPNLDIVDTTLVKVVKNGTSLKVLNIPPPDYTTDQAAIRFYNMGTTTGRVTGTLYGQGTTDGNNTGGGLPIGAANVTLIDSLAPNTVKVITGPQLGTLFGQTTWPGRAWLQIESEIKGLRVQALVRTIGVNGQVLTNMSDRVMLDGETLQRTE